VNTEERVLVNKWHRKFGPLIEATFSSRVSVISPPRTGSTLVARILWSSQLVSHHCHEPFEAMYWGNGGEETVSNVFTRPMEVATGVRRQLSGFGSVEKGLLIKEMTFQLAPDQFRFLARISTVPIIFVIQDPRLSASSRLRIVKELKRAETFDPHESGWPTLRDQIEICRQEDIPYLIVDSDQLRRNPQPILNRLATALELDRLESNWDDRSGLQLCCPEVGKLMGDLRTHDDPFYRRVLSSNTIEPPDAFDLRAIEVNLAKAGFGSALGEWMAIFSALAGDEHLLTA
jgi:hypothetical protein